MKGQKPKNSFSRPAIDLSSRKREWQEITLDRVQVGDTVVDVGLVSSIFVEHFRDDQMRVKIRMRLINVAGDPHDFFGTPNALKDPQGWDFPKDPQGWDFPTVRAFVEVF